MSPTTGRGGWFQRWWPPLLILAGLLVAWELAVHITNTPMWMLPPPSAVAVSLINDRALLLTHARVTLVEVLVGFAAAVVLGVACGIAIAVSPVLDRAFYPLVVASQTIPIPAIAPLLLIWFGYGLLPKIVVTTLVGFFPLVVGTVDGLRSVDPDAVRLLRVCGATPWRIFRLARIPAALPAVFSGARVAVAVCVIGAVFGELAGSNAGLGYLMVRAIAQFQTARVIACVLILSMMGVALFGIVSLAERILLPWRRFVTVGEGG